jgi:hypothetical protein
MNDRPSLRDHQWHPATTLRHTITAERLAIHLKQPTTTIRFMIIVDTGAVLQLCRQHPNKFSRGDMTVLPIDGVPLSSKGHRRKRLAHSALPLKGLRPGPDRTRATPCVLASASVISTSADKARTAARFSPLSLSPMWVLRTVSVPARSLIAFASAVNRLATA